MRLSKGLKLREVAGEYMLVPCGSDAIGSNEIFSLSESAAWLWKILGGRDFDEEYAVSLIMGEYEMDEETVRSDVSRLIALWRENGLVDE